MELFRKDKSESVELSENTTLPALEQSYVYYEVFRVTLSACKNFQEIQVSVKRCTLVARAKLTTILRSEVPATT